MSVLRPTSRHSPVPSYQPHSTPLKQRATAPTPAPNVMPAVPPKPVADDMDLRGAIVISAAPLPCMTRWWNAGVMSVLRWLFRPGNSHEFMRSSLDRLMFITPETLQKTYPNAQFKTTCPGEVDAEEISAERGLQRTILYLHGGAYFMGSIAGYRDHALRLSKACRANVVLLKYALAPEHAFPTGLNNAVSAYLALAAQRPDTPLFIGGDSAGGGLALALACEIRDRNIRGPKVTAPAGVFCLSPWADLTGSGTAVTENAKEDQWLTKRHMDQWASWYAGSTPTDNPQVSPARANYTGVAPLCLFAAQKEILLSDSISVANAARLAGVDVRLYVGQNMQHNWSLIFPALQQSEDLLQVVAKFVDKPA